MRKVIEIQIKNKVATLVHRDDYAVCGNSDFTVSFDFDSEWDSFENKTVRFRYQERYIDIIISDTTCTFPVIQNTEWVEIGVFAGNLCTTTPVRLPMRRSILCRGGEPATPTPSVYTQLMTLLTGKADKKQNVSQAGKLWKVGTDGELAFCDQTEPFSIHAQTEENQIADGDALVFYDDSASAHRKTTWSNIKEKLAASVGTMKIKLAGTAQTPDENGYINIPAATQNGNHGLIKIGASYLGLELDDAGVPHIRPCPDGNIANRGGYYLPITSFSMDYALKCAMTDGIGPAWSNAEKTGAWQRLNSVKTSMDAVLVAGAKYFLGIQSTLSLTLPANALAGQEIEVVVYSGATPLTITFASAFLGTLPVPEANRRIELNFLYDGTNWDLISKVEETE